MSSHRLGSLALLATLSGLSPAQSGRLLLAESDGIRLYRGAAAPNNVGLWVDNSSNQTVSCVVSWQNPNGSIAQAQMGDSRTIVVAPGGSGRVVTGLIGTFHESFNCRVDSSAAAADQRKDAQDRQAAAREAAAEAQRQRTALAVRQAAQRDEAAAAQLSRQQQQAQQDAAYQQKLRDQRAEQDRQNVEIARLGREQAARQRIAEQERQQQRDQQNAAQLGAAAALGNAIDKAIEEKRRRDVEKIEEEAAAAAAAEAAKYPKKSNEIKFKPWGSK